MQVNICWSRNVWTHSVGVNCRWQAFINVPWAEISTKDRAGLTDARTARRKHRSRCVQNGKWTQSTRHKQLKFYFKKRWLSSGWRLKRVATFSDPQNKALIRRVDAGSSLNWVQVTDQTEVLTRSWKEVQVTASSIQSEYAGEYIDI